ncbi:sugar ABC transporter permease [Ktedonobacter racemifer]|uniref:Binding-protein-dependent transport systems inner membrane component n=1 Tax=Ktedonobacter racemifer DSM 44963 TaxID=485913 RepID=D6U0F3_KTERA|nr:carbohydrate ABC transporter permease [Ktedonobacter racemifer]EFH82293.1 binding-protein-dependent transport systems inner membrane component [Ktedonobacter racemifer DSM 44963]
MAEITDRVSQPSLSSQKVVQKRRSGKRIGRTLESLGAHLIMIIVVILCVFPLIVIIATSLKQPQDIFTASFQLFPSHPTLDNYAHVLTDNGGIFFTWAFNSFKIAILTTIVGVLFAAPAAYAVSRWNFLGKQTILVSFLITQMFPGVLLLVPLYNLYVQFNLIDNHYGLVIAYATTALPFSVWMLKNFFDTVPKELDEAAYVDGLSSFQTFWRIVLPLTIPGVAVVGFFNFMAAWNEFVLAFTFLNDAHNVTLPVGIKDYVHNFGADWHLLTAAAVLVTIPVLIVFLWAQRYLITGLTGGSVKG